MDAGSTVGAKPGGKQSADDHCKPDVLKTTLIYGAF